MMKKLDRILLHLLRVSPATIGERAEEFEDHPVSTKEQVMSVCQLPSNKKVNLEWAALVLWRPIKIQEIFLSQASYIFRRISAFIIFRQI